MGMEKAPFRLVRVTVFVLNTNTFEIRLHAYQCWVQGKKKIISNTTRGKINIRHSQQLTLLLCLHGHSNQPSPNQVSTDWSSSTLSFSLAQYRYILELSLLWLLFVFFAFFFYFTFQVLFSLWVVDSLTQYISFQGKLHQPPLRIHKIIHLPSLAFQEMTLCPLKLE